MLSITTRPFYFGPRERLFGVLDLPRSESFERPAVVLCQPVVHESIWCHRACRQLATRLAAEGHPVLRFDWDGCGDSLGESDEVDLECWVGNVSTAIEYVRARFAGLVVIGLRMGATLALLARAEVERLVLWQPVVDGAAHLCELRSLHAAHAAHHGWKPGEGASANEVLGFTLSDAAVEAFADLDLASAELWETAPPRILHLVNEDGSDQAALRARLTSAGATPERRYVDEPHAWVAEPFKLVMPVKSLAAVVDWISEDAS